MVWIKPITDRTLVDVLFADNNRGSPESLKGSRNYVDLNRIAENIWHVRDTLIRSGFSVPELVSKRGWTEDDFPLDTDIAKIRADLLSLRIPAAISADTPEVPTLPYLHFQKLNDIEKILYDLETKWKNAGPIYRISGTFYSGMEGYGL